MIICLILLSVTIPLLGSNRADTVNKEEYPWEK